MAAAQLCLLAVAAVCFLSAPSAARAGDASSYEVSCPANNFLTGLRFRSGAWVDAIGIQCSSFDFVNQMFGAPTPVGDLSGGGGGSPHDGTCPGNGAVGALLEEQTRDPDAGHLDNVAMRCVDPIANQYTGYLTINTDDGRSDGDVIGELEDVYESGREDYAGPPGCDAGSLGVGIQGAIFQNAVEDVELICQPFGSEKLGSTASKLTTAPALQLQSPGQALKNAGTSVIAVIPPKCPAGSRQVADQNHLPVTWVAFPVSLNGQTILCAKPGPKTTVDHMGTTSPAIPCPAGTERHADGKCVAKLKVAKKTAPDGGLPTKLCPDGSQPLPDGSCVTLHFNANNPIPFLCPNGSCLKTAPPPNLATQSPVHPGDPICPGGAARLKNGQCPTTPGQSNLHLFGTYKAPANPGTSGLH